MSEQLNPEGWHRHVSNLLLRKPGYAYCPICGFIPTEMLGRKPPNLTLEATMKQDLYRSQRREWARLIGRPYPEDGGDQAGRTQADDAR